jgi:Caspase domain
MSAVATGVRTPARVHSRRNRPGAEEKSSSSKISSNHPSYRSFIAEPSVPARHCPRRKCGNTRHVSVLMISSIGPARMFDGNRSRGWAMGYCSRWALFFLVIIFAPALVQHASLAAEMRFALVIGNNEYKSAKLATPANDAGLVASTLQAAGFTVTGAPNLDQATLRESFREFLGQLEAAEPDAVAVVYLAGFGLQFAGETYFVPVDADLQRDVDVPLQAIRISDFTQPLAALPGRVKIVILDAPRQNPFTRGGQPLASGLALVDPAPGMAIAFNAAPGTVGPEEPGPYGAYATSLTEMIAAGGLGLDDLFARLRLRVSELT